MPDTTITDLAAALERGEVLIDVRERAEYAEAHVPGAVNVPMAELPRRLDEIDRSRPVHVICASGNRSSAMVDVLASHGIEANNVTGGTQAWIAAGHHIDTEG